MAFTNLLNAIFGVDKPITSATGLALRDNLLAVIAGMTGAPRVEGRAMGGVVLGYNGNTVEAVYTDVDRVAWVECVINGTADGLVQVQFSADDGASWTTPVSVMIGTGGWDTLRLNLDTGDFFHTGDVRFDIDRSGVLSVPSNCNALRLTYFSGGSYRGFHCDAKVLTGIE